MMDIEATPILDVELVNEGSVEVDPLIVGLKGEKGEKGDPGETPIRGEDYWTEADIQEIKSYCDGLIVDVLGGSY